MKKNKILLPNFSSSLLICLLNLFTYLLTFNFFLSISLLVHSGFYSVHTGADAGAKFLTDKMNMVIISIIRVMVPTMQLYIHIATRKDPSLSFSPCLSTSIGQSYIYIIPLAFFFLLIFSSVLLSSPLPFPSTLPLLPYPILP